MEAKLTIRSNSSPTHVHNNLGLIGRGISTPLCITVFLLLVYGNHNKLSLSHMYGKEIQY